MQFRIAFVVVLSSAIALTGLPAAGAADAEVAPPTVTQDLAGLPAQHDLMGASALSAGSDDALLSEPVATPIPFSAVGLDLPEGAEVEVRTSVDGETWTDWQLAEAVDEAPDPDSPEAARASSERHSSPIWVGEAEHLQLRVTGGSPEDVGVHLIDSMGLGRSLAGRFVDAFRAAWRGGAQPAAASVAAPKVITRAQWGADESRRTGNPSYASNAKVAVVHHTATTNSYSAAEAAGQVRAIYAYHTGTLRWNDIGYNLLIDRYGRIYEGRAGGLERAVIGAHAGGWNTGSYGVALLGQHEPGASPSYAPVTSAALDALVDVLAWKHDVHYIDADATVRLTSGGGGTSRYPAGVSIDVPTIIGHITLSTTACPGRSVIDQLGSIRSRVSQRQTAMFVQPQVGPTDIPLAPGGTPETVTFRAGLSPAGSWSLRITASGGKVVHSASGSGSSVSTSWRPPATPDIYTYELASSGRRPVKGEITVLRDVVERVGTSGSVPTASAQVSKRAFPQAASAEHAVVARADKFADAMAGGPLAGTTGPLLLTDSGSLHPDVLAELKRVLPAGRTVYLLGGHEALAPAVETALKAHWQVRRVKGSERTATAAEVAAVVRARTGTTTAMVARAVPDDVAPWADALAGGAYGAKAGIPVLLTYPDRLTEPTRKAISAFKRTYVLGGTAAVSDAVVAQLPSPQRIRGGDRVGTSVRIAELWGSTGGTARDRVLLGAGYQPSSWTLALAAAPLAARQGSPLILTATDTLSPAAREHLQRMRYSSVPNASGMVLGGSGHVSDAVVSEVSRLLQ